MMTSSDAASGIRAFTTVLRLFCVVPFLTGVVDVIGGAWILRQAGAVLPAGIAADPVLNNQIAFWGAIWLGFGACLWWVSHDPLGRAALARMLLVILFVSGLARLYALARWGFAGPLLTGAMAVELALGPALLWWLSRLQRSPRR